MRVLSWLRPPAPRLTSARAPVEVVSVEHAQTDGRRYHDSTATKRPHWLEVLIGATLIVTWLGFFAVGVIFASVTYCNNMNNASLQENVCVMIGNWVMFLCSYTVTNIGILCCLTACMGEVGRRTGVDGKSRIRREDPGDYVAAIMRGFLVYLAILAGLVIGNSSFSPHTRDEYVRLASLVSLMGFLAGFNPLLFRRLQGFGRGVFAEREDAQGTVDKSSGGQVAARAHLLEGKHAGEAKKRVELINARNEAERAVSEVETLLKEHESKLTEADRSAILSAVDRVKEVSKGEDTAAIKQAIEGLMQASHAMA
jgi:hypothetical protein